jgi:dipeptidyl-peptidase-4
MVFCQHPAYLSSLTLNRMRLPLSIVFSILFFVSSAQYKWSKDGQSFLHSQNNNIVQYTLPAMTNITVVEGKQLIPEGQSKPLTIKAFTVSPDQKQFLLYANSRRVWRAETRGDYFLYDPQSKELKKLGAGLPSSSLMFAKFSPDGSKVAYVSRNNIYTEDLVTGKISALTTDGTDRIINGTFDWAYEEEFGLRDGFRWSPDSKSIAFWHIDARKIRNFNLINNTDSIYSHVVPIEYPKVGYDPSPTKIVVVSVADASSRWLDIHGDPALH